MKTISYPLLSDTNHYVYFLTHSFRNVKCYDLFTSLTVFVDEVMVSSAS